MVNRSVVVAVAKEPFREWLRSLPDPEDLSLEKINEDCSAYLIPAYGYDEDRDKIIKQCYNIIFEDQLAGWWTLEEDWPRRRDLRTFRKWFDLRFHSIVEDLVEGAIVYG